DEILTGFHRTGPLFYFADLGFVPDVVLLSKAMGNGFPVSAVVADRTYPVVPAMFPGSTFAANPLAAAAAAATLRQVPQLDLPARVDRIDAALRAALTPLEDDGLAVRGGGAMWVVEMPPEMDGTALHRRILDRGVATGHAGRFLRLLPPATVAEENLHAA